MTTIRRNGATYLDRAAGINLFATGHSAPKARTDDERTPSANDEAVA